ncbi:putative 4-coumarate--CoA ligase 3 [Blattella germanica]|nr:putative 4-coumarate--CoA ligase 3 [Blattella germanica]
MPTNVRCLINLSEMNPTCRNLRQVNRLYKSLRVVASRHSSHQAKATQDQHILRSPHPDVTIPEITLVDMVWDMVDKFPDHTALSREIARRFASSLRKAGFKRGDTLAVALYNCPEFHLVMLGAIEAGLIVTTVNPEYTHEEIARQIMDSGASGIVTTPESYPVVAKAVLAVEASKKVRPPIIVTPGLTSSSVPLGAISFREMTQESVDTSNLKSSERPVPNDVALLPYSSGTSGLPKGVRLSHRNIITNCLQMCNTPALWIVDPTTGKATVLYLVPPLVQFLGAHPSVKGEIFKTVHAMTSGAGPIGQADAQRVLDKAAHLRFIQGYGLTEASPLVSILQRGDTNFSASGVPIPNTLVKIVNIETGTNLGPGEVGELCVHGPQVMLGYHNNPTATAETIDSSGWLHTGDMGYFDETNNLFIVDRLKELIKVKGFQVAPAELEEILRQHPLVGDAAVIGVPHERMGEVPKAYIVPRDPKLTEEDLKGFVAAKVAEYKQLGGVEFVQSIPKNPSGKILRRKLREMYCK